MKFKNTLLWSALLAGGLTAACKKDAIKDIVKPDPIDTPAGNTTPTFAGADGVLWAVNATKVIAGSTVHIGTGVAVFYKGSPAFVDVGNVTINDYDMSKQSDNSYIYTPTVSSPLGISFTTGVSWDMQGGNGHQPLSYDDPNVDYPTGSAITSGTTVTKANGYTLTCSSVTNAYSTMFMIGSISKTVPGNVTSCTFSASELSALPAGTTVVQIVPYAVTGETINGKKYYFGKESVNQLSVTVE